MKRLIIAATAAARLSVAYAADDNDRLPVWDAGEKKVLEEGGWLAGAALLTREGNSPSPQTAPEPNEPAADGPPAATPPTESTEPLDLPAPLAGELTENEAQPSEVPEKFWDAYFAAKPECFLIDPQGLLAAIDHRDRLAFLNYHSSDSSVDLFVYLFKGEEDIPGELRKEETAERLFSSGRPAAVVYYYLGAPQRSALYLSPSLTETISTVEQRRGLGNSVMQASHQVEPARQLEAFLVQMSIQIYWMERMLGTVKDANGLADEPPAKHAKPPEKKSEIMRKVQLLLEPAKRWSFHATLVSSFLVFVGIMIFWWRKRVRYRFPEFEVEARLGGTHAAGVGAVISFASASCTPASQKDQAPRNL